MIEPLRDGRLCLTSVVELSKVITPGNRAEVLPRFFQLSKREAKAVSAALQPNEAAPHREVVTAVRPATFAPGERPPPLGPVHSAPDVPGPDPHAGPVVHPDEPRRANTPESGAPPSPPRSPSSSAEPLTADLSRLHVTVSRRFLRKLEAARAALSHSHPGAGAEEILEAGLDLFLERHAKRRGLVERPRRNAPAAKPDHVPAHVKRAVRERDGGRCQWALDGGGICGSTHQVELDHVVPRALGGPPTIENTRLLCRVHNDLAARRVYGDAWMDRFRRGRTARTPGETRDAPSSP